MNPKEIFVIASDAEADREAARIIETIRQEMFLTSNESVPDLQPLRANLEPRFFGVGGREMRSCGIELIHEWRSVDCQLIYRAVLQRQPNAILCIGQNALYRHFASALKKSVRKHSGTFANWAIIFLIETKSGKTDEKDYGEFDEILDLSDEAAASRIVKLLNWQMTHFPLKAALTS